MTERHEDLMGKVRHALISEHISSKISSSASDGVGKRALCDKYGASIVELKVESTHMKRYFAVYI